MKGTLEENLKTLLSEEKCDDKCGACNLSWTYPCNPALVKAIKSIIQQERKDAVKHALTQTRQKGAGSTCVSIYDIDRTYEELYKESLL